MPLAYTFILRASGNEASAGRDGRKAWMAANGVTVIAPNTPGGRIDIAVTYQAKSLDVKEGTVRSSKRISAHFTNNYNTEGNPLQQNVEQNGQKLTKRSLIQGFFSFTWCAAACPVFKVRVFLWPGIQTGLCHVLMLLRE